MKEKTDISQEEMQILMQERDDLEAKIKEEGLNIAKQTVEDRTGLVFDDKDPEWNEFVVKRFQIDSSMYKYTSLIERFIGTIIFIYFIISIVFISFDIGSSMPLLGEYFTLNTFKSNSLFYIQLAKYFLIYFILTQYLIHNVLVYCCLWRKINLSRILYKHVRASKWQNITGFLVFSLMCIPFWFDTEVLTMLITNH